MMLNKNQNIAITIIFFNLFWINFAFAENLLEVYYLAIENDPTVLAAKENQLADQEDLVIARAKLLPVIGVSGNQIYGKMSDSFYSYVRTNNNSKNYALSIAQPIFQVVDWMKLKMVKKQTLSSFKKYESIEQELILRVAEKYFAVLAAIDQLETSRAATKAFSKRLEQATQQFKVGVSAITDVNDAQARLDNSRAKEISDANLLNTAKEDLSKIIGKFINNICPLKQQISLVPPDPVNIDLWVEKARQYNLKLQAARLDVEAARENIRASSSNHLPTLNLSSSISTSSNPLPMPGSPSRDRTRVKELTLNLNVPIFAGGTVVATTQAAIFKTNAVLQQLEASYRDAESNTRTSYHSVLTQISQVDALQQSVKSSRIALKATQAAFNVGTRTMVDVLNAQTDLLNAERDHIKAKYDYILSSLKLKQATGSLSGSDLEQINDLLEKENINKENINQDSVDQN